MSENLGTELHVGDEIERRFLVHPRDVATLGHMAEDVAFIKQGYARDEKGKKYRVRAIDNLLVPHQPTAYEWARKKRCSDVHRREFERLLKRREFEDIWPNTAGWRITKHRLMLPQLGACALDLFDNGLPVIEFEYKTLEESADFVPPECCGLEITGLQGWGSSGLAKRPMGAEELARTLTICGQREGVVPPR